jgi:hypothetical protein
MAGKAAGRTTEKYFSNPKNPLMAARTDSYISKNLSQIFQTISTKMDNASWNLILDKKTPL